MQRDLWPPNSFIGIFFSIIFLFIMQPLFIIHQVPDWVLQIFHTILVLSIIYALSNHRLLLLISALLGAAYIFLHSLSLYTHSHLILKESDISFVLFMGLASCVFAVRVFKTQLVDTNIVFGAIALYFFIGIIWAVMFDFIQYIFPGSFHGIDSTLSTGPDFFLVEAKKQLDTVYFSYTTLTTLGYGDIVPLSPLAKSFAALEAASGQLFIATVLATLVSLWKRN